MRHARRRHHLDAGAIVHWTLAGVALVGVYDRGRWSWGGPSWAWPWQGVGSA